MFSNLENFEGGEDLGEGRTQAGNKNIKAGFWVCKDEGINRVAVEVGGDTCAVCCFKGYDCGRKLWSGNVFLAGKGNGV